MRRALTPYLLVAPAAILLLVFVYGVVMGVLQGFGIMPFLGKTDFTLEYWARALAAPDLKASVLFSLYLATVSSVLAVAGGVLLCAALVTVKASRKVQLFDIQIPLMTAHTLVVLSAVSLFAGSGLFPRVLNALGIVSGATDFSSVVGDPSGWGIIFVYLWKEIPFIAFCTLTIMTHVSDKFGEAAATMGSSPVRTFFSITLPLCKGAILKAFLVVFAFVFGAFEVPFLLGPTLPKALPILAYIEYSNPDLLNRCMAMAVNGIMLLISVLLAVAYFKVLRLERDGRQ